ncbi:MAG: hypothetical protein ACK5V3_14040, partial [Bdellovibrionales bacterium]
MSAVNSNLLFIGLWDKPLIEKWGAQNQLTLTETINSNIVILDAPTLHNKNLERIFLSWKITRPHLQVLALTDGT